MATIVKTQVIISYSLYIVFLFFLQFKWLSYFKPDSFQSLLVLPTMFDANNPLIASVISLPPKEKQV